MRKFTFILRGGKYVQQEEQSLFSVKMTINSTEGSEITLIFCKVYLQPMKF